MISDHVLRGQLEPAEDYEDGPAYRLATDAAGRSQVGTILGERRVLSSSLLGGRRGPLMGRGERAPRNALWGLGSCNGRKIGKGRETHGPTVPERREEEMAYVLDEGWRRREMSLEGEVY